MLIFVLPMLKGQLKQILSQFKPKTRKPFLMNACSKKKKKKKKKQKKAYLRHLYTCQKIYFALKPEGV